ncbi:unnamed protein product [Protopolystoma xenopodis]|uniref:Uncharacterized protein n=1 Tax=Protopolystoma xenopodis TaxID=117903 RepID=A0A448WR37_9PLAT|nr:unnamed protein product [Protopolystoma xenopodis]
MCVRTVRRISYLLPPQFESPPNGSLLTPNADALTCDWSICSNQSATRRQDAPSRPTCWEAGEPSRSHQKRPEPRIESISQSNRAALEAQCSDWWTRQAQEHLLAVLSWALLRLRKGPIRARRVHQSASCQPPPASRKASLHAALFALHQLMQTSKLQLFQITSHVDAGSGGIRKKQDRVGPEHVCPPKENDKMGSFHESPS